MAEGEDICLSLCHCPQDHLEHSLGFQYEVVPTAQFAPIGVILNNPISNLIDEVSPRDKLFPSCSDGQLSNQVAMNIAYA